MDWKIFSTIYFFVHISVASAQGILYGKVMNSKSKEPLMGVAVSCDGATTVTDQRGFYSLHISTNEEIFIEYTYYNYETKIISVRMRGNKLVDVELEENLIQLSEVIVKNTKPYRKITTTNIPASKLNTTPALLAETDPIKAFQYLPSIQWANEGQSNNVIRGQAPDAGLLIVDGIPLYNSNHAMGLLSIINPEAVKDMTFYNGYLPASLGGKMGGVLDILTKDGDLNNYRGNASLGIISARMNAEMPIIKDKISLTIAGRRSLIDLFIPLVTEGEDDKTNFRFYDSNIKLTYKPNNRTTVALIGLLSGDRLWSENINRRDNKTSGQDWKWGTNGWGLMANHIASPKWSSQIMLSVSDFWRKEYIYSRKENNNENTEEERHKHQVSEYRFIWGNKFYINNDFTLHTGIGATRRKTLIQQTNQMIFWEANASTDAYWQTFPWLKTQIGLRMEQPYFVFSPRIATIVSLSPSSNLQLAYNRTSQRMLVASTNNSILQSDIWFTPNQSFLPSVSNNTSITISNTPTNWLYLSLTGYYIHMKRIIEYKESFTRIEAYEQLSDRVTIGKGYSTGLEAQIEAKWNKTEVNVAYSYSKVRHLFEEINSGKWFRPYYDRPHRLMLSVNYQPNKRWILSATWQCSSGSVQTIALEKLPMALPYPNQSIRYIEQISEKNNYRLPNYHRLDISAGYKREKWTFTFSLYNAYNRQNIYRASVEENETDTTKKIKGMTLLPIIPGLNVKYSF